jgi:hypothetical protein
MKHRTYLHGFHEDKLFLINLDWPFKWVTIISLKRNLSMIKVNRSYSTYHIYKLHDVLQLTASYRVQTRCNSSNFSSHLHNIEWGFRISGSHTWALWVDVCPSHYPQLKTFRGVYHLQTCICALIGHMTSHKYRTVLIKQQNLKVQIFQLITCYLNNLSPT